MGGREKGGGGRRRARASGLAGVGLSHWRPDRVVWRACPPRGLGRWAELDLIANMCRVHFLHFLPRFLDFSAKCSETFLLLFSPPPVLASSSPLPMHRTIFDTPVVNTFLRAFSRITLRLTGWTVEGQLPDKATKSVLIAAPHTSNWDLPYTLMLAFVLRLRVYWMGKHSLFKGPLGPVMRWLGGHSGEP